MKRVLFFIYIYFLAFFSYGDNLMIFGSKTFDVKDVKIDGDLTRFILENPDLNEGFSIKQSLRLKVSGDIAKGISINALFDDTKVQNDQTEITLFMKGKKISGSLGDITTTFDGNKYIFFNKKTKGLEIKSNNGRFYILAAKTSGTTVSQIFTGQGFTQDYVLKNYPIVKGSETIIINGKKLIKGTDYEIDYEDGTITLDKSILPVESDTKIYVNYQYIDYDNELNRKLYGLGTKFYLKNLTLTGAFFSEKDSGNYSEDSKILPMEHNVYSYGVNFSKNYFGLKYDKFFCDIDNNLDSDEKEEDRKIKTEGENSEVFLDKSGFSLKFRKLKKDIGFKMIGKDEPTTPINQDIKSVSYSKKNFNVSYEKTDNENLVFNDPFLGVFGGTPVVFSEKSDNLAFSGGSKLKISATFANKDKNSQDNKKYSQDNKNLNAQYFLSNALTLNFSFVKNYLENETDRVISTDLEKNVYGFNLKKNNYSMAFSVSDITDKGKNINENSLNLQTFSDKFTAMVALKERREDEKKDKVGDMSFTYTFNDFVDFQFRYNASNTVNYLGTSEITIDNELFNYKVDLSGDYHSVMLFWNLRNRTSEDFGKESESDMFMLDGSYSPSDIWSYKLKITDMKNSNYKENAEIIDDKTELKIIRSTGANTKISFNTSINDKSDNKTKDNNYEEFLQGISFEKTGKFEYNLSFYLGRKKYDYKDDTSLKIFGNNIKYNLTKNSNLSYDFNYKTESDINSRLYSDDEFSFNKNIKGKTVIKVYLKRKKVPEDTNGKEYSYSILGVNFDTNF